MLAFVGGNVKGLVLGPAEDCETIGVGTGRGNLVTLIVIHFQVDIGLGLGCQQVVHPDVHFVVAASLGHHSQIGGKHIHRANTAPVVRRLRRVARTPIVVIIITTVIIGAAIIIITVLRRRPSVVENIGQLGISVGGLVGARICRQQLLDTQTYAINGARLGCYQLVQFDCEGVGRRQIVLLRIEQYEFIRNQTADTLKLTRAANVVHLQKLAYVAFFYLNHLDQNSPVIA